MMSCGMEAIATCTASSSWMISGRMLKVCAQIGVTMSARTFGFTMGPPADSE